MAMLINVIFHPLDELTRDTIDRIEGTVLTLTESATARWEGHHLIYRTHRDASEVVGDWENEGFDFSEFMLFQMTPIQENHNVVD